MVKQYPEFVKSYAQKYGNKGANLLFMSKNLKQLSEGLHAAKVLVPEVKPIDHKNLFNFIDSHAPGKLKRLWEEVCNLAETDQTLSERVKAKLYEIQTLIKDTLSNSKKCFLEDEINHDFVIARSTGEKEDSEEMANPGGNDSIVVKGTKQNLSEAIAGVLASYFSVKSFSQRMASGQGIADVFDKKQMPKLSCIYQHFVGDVLTKGENYKKSLTSNLVPPLFLALLTQMVLVMCAFSSLMEQMTSL